MRKNNNHTCGPKNIGSENNNLKMIFALTLVHFTGDFYSSFINPLMPVFVDHFSLTLTQVGIITGISRFLAFVSQSLLTYLPVHYARQGHSLVSIGAVVSLFPLPGRSAV